MRSAGAIRSGSFSVSSALPRFTGLARNKRERERERELPHTFFLAPRHAGPIGLLANDQVKVRTGVVQHCQWDSLDDRVRVATLSK